jgi:hypothetical protein
LLFKNNLLDDKKVEKATLSTPLVSGMLESSFFLEGEG